MPVPITRKLRLTANPASCARRSEEHTSELQSHLNLVCRLLLEKKKEPSQSSDDDKSHPVAHNSKILNPHERNNNIYNKHMLAELRPVQPCHHNLERYLPTVHLL